jgi:hypothetical protein
MGQGSGRSGLREGKHSQTEKDLCVEVKRLRRSKDVGCTTAGLQAWSPTAGRPLGLDTYTTEVILAVRCEDVFPGAKDVVMGHTRVLSNLTSAGYKT